MVKVLKFVLSFNKPLPHYMAGETISGVVELSLRSRMRLKELTLRLLGESTIFWMDKELNSKNEPKSVSFSNHEVYFVEKFKLWQQGDDNKRLEGGDHTFRFTFTLPQNIPSSFESSIGSVQYKAEAEIIKRATRNKKCKVPFFVNTLYNINEIREALLPVTSYVEKSENASIFPIAAHAAIDRKGYIPGEILRLNAELTNHSEENIVTQASLVAVIKYYSMLKAFEETKTVYQSKPWQIMPNQNFKIQEAITIPPVPPSKLMNCKIIDLDYQIVVSAKPPNGTGIVLNLPIIIGTIASNDFPRYEAANCTEMPTAPNPFAEFCPPPSYEECMSEATN